MKHFFPPVLCGVNVGLDLGLAISRPGWHHLFYAALVLLWSAIAYSYAKSGLSSIKSDIRLDDWRKLIGWPPK